jgi:NAD-dependent deacetylase
MSLEKLAADVRATSGLLLVVTGAGLSLASGIPTFRGSDPGAVWKRDVTELGTLRYFREEPHGSWRWYLSRFEKAAGAKPNPGHTAIVEIERLRAARGEPFLLVTQNIDGLHHDAGSRVLVEVHGAARRARCSQDGCVNGAPRGSVAMASLDLAPFRENPVRENVPRCSVCGSFIRQHVLWFDEMYQSHEDYGWDRVIDAAQQCELLLFAGTSLAVGVTDLLLSEARRRRVPVYNLDPGGEERPGVTLIREPSETLLPALAALL